MKIDESLILRLEALARLELSESERSEILGDLGKILTMVEKLREINLEEIEPLLHVTDSTNTAREDKVREQLSADSSLLNAPSSKAQYFTVPKVIERHRE